MQNNYKEEWLIKLKNLIYSLKGGEVTRVTGWREPLTWLDEDDTIPVYRHADLPFEHLAWMFIELKDSRTFRLSTCQNDSVWGLYLTSVDSDFDYKKDERVIDLSFQLKGLIDNIEITVDDEDISVVKLFYNDRSVIFVAGEVEPGYDEIIIRTMDESILFFNNPDDLAKLVLDRPLPFIFE